MKGKRKIVIFAIVSVLIGIIGFYSFVALKRRYIINDYFAQGRWSDLRQEFNKKKKVKHSTIFFGDSMTENFKSLPQSDSVLNMGISGDFTEGLIKRIDNVINFQPDKVFIMIGINDIIEKVPLDDIEENYIKILDLIKTNCPNTKIYIQSTLPTYGKKSTLSSSKGVNLTVQELNVFLQTIAQNRELTFIDMYSDFANEDNELKKELTTDGIHLNDKGYEIWLSHIDKHLK